MSGRVKESFLALKLRKHEGVTVTCPACGSEKVKQMITSFITRTAKKS